MRALLSEGFCEGPAITLCRTSNCRHPILQSITHSSDLLHRQNSQPLAPRQLVTGRFAWLAQLVVDWSVDTAADSDRVAVDRNRFRRAEEGDNPCHLFSVHKTPEQV